MSDFSNPLAVLLPYHFNSAQEYPTEVLAIRFQAWRSIIKDLVSYMKEYASVQEEIVRQQLRLQHAVGSSAGSSSSSGPSSTTHNNHAHHHSTSANADDINAINKFFLPIGNGSVQDLPTILTKYHQKNVTNCSKTLKDINQIIIPKLDELRKDLLVKIKEIKNLQNDFKNSLDKELTETKHLLNQYQHTIELSNKLEHGGVSQSGANDEVAKYDPYLVKLKLDRQLKKQLSEENYLYDAYDNLQTSGGKLESIIVMEIQNYLRMFLDLLSNEHSTIPNFLVPNLAEGFLSKEANFEWDSFISKNLPSPSISLSAVSHNNSQVKNGTFIDLSFPARKITDLAIADFDSPLNISIREGYLERRSKFLKSYSSGWYVLTCNYLHEFKTPDRKKDPVPVLSLLLDQCHPSEHSKDDGKANGIYKFVVYTKLASGIISKGHNLVFRTDTYKKMIEWYNDIKNLTGLPTPAARARYVSKNFKPTISSTNQKISRNSSLVSSRARSIKSSSTTNSRPVATASTPKTHLKTVRSRPTSVASSANPNRLSSTFSNRNGTHSPRLANMINSDGTIITPVETYERNHSHHDIPLQHQPQNFHHLQPQASPQSYVPAQGYFIATNENQQPIQQFYDPVQQQVYTISSGVPQPQFFPASPNPQYIPVGNQNGQVINTANYFPQQYAEGGSQLPYPVNQTQPSLDSNEHRSLDVSGLGLNENINVNGDGTGKPRKETDNGTLNSDTIGPSTSEIEEDMTKVTVSDEK